MDHYIKERVSVGSRLKKIEDNTITPGLSLEAEAQPSWVKGRSIQKTWNWGGVALRDF